MDKTNKLLSTAPAIDLSYITSSRAFRGTLDSFGHGSLITLAVSATLIVGVAAAFSRDARIIITTLTCMAALVGVALYNSRAFTQITPAGQQVLPISDGFIDELKRVYIHYRTTIPIAAHVVQFASVMYKESELSYLLEDRELVELLYQARKPLLASYSLYSSLIGHLEWFLRIRSARVGFNPHTRLRILTQLHEEMVDAGKNLSTLTHSNSVSRVINYIRQKTLLQLKVLNYEHPTMFHSEQMVD